MINYCPLANPLAYHNPQSMIIMSTTDPMLVTLFTSNNWTWVTISEQDDQLIDTTYIEIDTLLVIRHPLFQQFELDQMRFD